MLKRLWQRFAPPSADNPNQIQSFVLEPILTPSGLIDAGDDLPDPTPVELPEVLSALHTGEETPTFESGYFTVGDTGEVGIDFLFDGGKYKFELGIFSLEGLDAEAGSEEFIEEAARRSLSESELGHVVLFDQSEGAKFEGDLGEGKNWNSGDYQGVKTVQMRSGERFGIMLVPNGTVEEVYENPSVGGAKQPLFSLSTANPDDTLHIGQIADVTGDGNTFVMEDVRFDHSWYDQDYNDLIFQVRGATGKAELLDNLIDPDSDWQETELGRELIESAQEAVKVPDPPIEAQPLVGAIQSPEIPADHPDIDYNQITLGQDHIDGDDNPLSPLEESGGETDNSSPNAPEAINNPDSSGVESADTEAITTLDQDESPLWVGRADTESWGESLREFVDTAREAGPENAIAYLNTFEPNVLNPLDTDTLTDSQKEALSYAQDNGVLVIAVTQDGQEINPTWEQETAPFDNLVIVEAATESPQVAADLVGQLSQVWAINPDLSYQQVIDIFQETATDQDPETGAAIVDIAAASYLAAATIPDASKVGLQPPPNSAYNPETDWQGWESGTFTVGETGEIHADFLYDGGIYQGEVAVFSLDGMEQYKPGSPEFIAEASRRSLEQANQGGILFQDQTQGTRFPSPENQGDYPGKQTVTLTPGDEVGVMLVPNGTVADLAENPALGLSQQPLFSMTPVQAIDEFNGGYLADITGDGKTFTLEENKNPPSVRNYQDLIFQLTGATANVPSLDDVIDPSQDWRDTAFGQTLVEAISFVPSGDKIVDSLSSRVRFAVTRSQNLNNYNPTALAQTQEWVVGISPGQSPSQLADLLGADHLKATGHIPNTHVWKFPKNKTPQQIVKTLEGFPGLEFAYPLVPINLTFNSPANEPLVQDGTQWHLQNNIQETWDQSQGEDTVIGFVDNGFDTDHEDLAGNYRADLSRDFDEKEADGITYDHDPDSQISTTYDYESSFLVQNSDRATAPTSIWSGQNQFELDIRSLSSGEIATVAANVEITSTSDNFNPDTLTPTLVSSEGERVPLTHQNNGHFVLDNNDQNALVGQTPNGTWFLEIESPTYASLENWSLNFNTQHNHGTAVTGVAAAQGDNQTGGTGIAPNTSWAGLRMGADETNWLEVADALSYLHQDIDIYNNSWGFNPFQSLDPLVEYALETSSQTGRDGLGNVYIFAAGNQGNSRKEGDETHNVNYNSYANSRHTIAVGAIDSTGQHSQYSEVGSSLFVSAYSNNGKTFNKSHASFLAPDGLPIPDDGTAITSNLEVSDFTGNLDNLAITLNIDHEQYEDLDVTLISPSGTPVKLFADVPFDDAINQNPADPISSIYGPALTLNNGAERDTASVLDENSPFQGVFRPQGDLSQFAGENPNGTWQLQIKDQKTGETGHLKKWQLALMSDGITTTSNEDDYMHGFGGTSAAAPYVSGVVALMLEANPTLTARDIQHILAQTAQQNDPDDPDWKQNGGGYWVNEKYGFGAVDAEAAVNLAKEWQPVGREVSLSQTDDQPKLIQTDQEVTGSIEFNNPDNEMTVEWAEVEFNAIHPNRGTLEVVLEHRYEDADGNQIVSESTLAKPNGSTGEDYNWIFTSAHHWGEPSYGEWTLKVTDTQNTSHTREWQDWTLNLHGAKPIVNIEATDPEATEGEDTGAFTISRTGHTDQPLTVHYDLATTGHWGRPPGTNGTDYEELSGSVTIPVGESSVVVPVQPIDDEVTEWPETVKLNLTDHQDYEVSEQSTDTVTIWDNETPKVKLYAEWYHGVTDEFHQENYTSEAGNNGGLLFRRVGDISEDLTVDLSLTGTATNGVDYDLPTSIVIPAGEHDNNMKFTPIDDDEVEGEETIQLDIKPSENYEIQEGWGSRKTVIWDDDDKPTVSIIPTDPEASEYGDPGEFTVKRTGDTSEDLVVHYFVSPYWWHRATQGEDFAEIPESITIPAGESSATITINPIDDTQVEKDELVELFLLENENYTLSSRDRTHVDLLDNDTQTLTWTQQLGTPEYDNANAVAFDSQNNAYIAGRTSGELNAPNGGLYDSFLAKYDSDGKEEWQVQLGATGYDTASALTVDQEDNLYVTGWTDGSMDGTSNQRDAWVAKYNSEGEQLWKRELASNYDFASGVAVDPSGNVYLTGRTSQADIWLAKYDANGNPQNDWGQTLGTGGVDDVHGIDVDDAGNVYLTGQTQGQLGEKIFSEGDVWQDHEGEDMDAWVAKFNSDGTQDWLKRLGTMTEDIAHGIKVDSNHGTVYLSGQTRGWFGDIYTGDADAWTGDHDAWWDARHGTKDDFGGTFYGETDAWVAQIDATAGNLNWKRQIGTEAYDTATSVAVDALGSVYLAGNTRGSMDETSQFGAEDVWTAKYDVAGALQWRQQYGTAAKDTVADMILAGNGIYLTGTTGGQLGESDAGKEDAWTMKLV
ncbi:S8 family serine peptidase [Spirulina sp. CS-785/01]|uniref:SBBP repeat-containing protein n=1 Tax=Spirulina sp. CS-785/01 TaxID=3021716 RepID=UPI00232CE9B9|nr:SBBP repeat-containing protein [Spirulina sp. CS-785/01]MDB9312363.1 S8 family serine peptidase [Spirulina sp. CS-785/01]